MPRSTEGFADLMADERLAVRFIIEPADAATVRDFRAQAERLWAERHAPPDTLGGRIRHIGSSLWWGVRQRSSLSRLRRHAAAVEEKARDRLLTMQIHCWIQAPTRTLAEGRMMWLLQGFDACASWRNWLRTHARAVALAALRPLLRRGTVVAGRDVRGEP